MRRLLFELKYLRGRAPWDRGIVPPEVLALVEKGLPPGRALDVGCGSGTSSVFLAAHGWDVVGVDFSALAIRRARRRARRAGVRCAFYRADATDLSFLDGPFDLALDIGCLHGIPQPGRARYAAGLARLLRPAGLYLLYAICPSPDRPARPGIAPAAVRELFAPAFVVERQEEGRDRGRPSVWYWMSRRAADDGPQTTEHS